MKISCYVLIGVLFTSIMWRVGRFICLGGCYLVYSVVVVSGVGRCKGGEGILR